MSEKTESNVVPVDDFADLYLSDTTVIDLENPKTGEPLLFKGLPVRAHVFGPSTEVYEKAQDRLNREATKRVLAMAANGKKKAQDSDPEADIKFLIAVTSHFDNLPFPGGVEGIYRERKFRHINKQVQTFVGDMGNFFVSGEKA